MIEGEIDKVVVFFKEGLNLLSVEVFSMVSIYNNFYVQINYIGSNKIIKIIDIIFLFKMNNLYFIMGMVFQVN